MWYMIIILYIVVIYYGEYKFYGYSLVLLLGHIRTFLLGVYMIYK